MKHRLNFRPVLFGAFALAAGICIYFDCRLARFSPATAAVVLLFCLFIVQHPVRRKQFFISSLCFVVLCSLGVGLAHWNTERYLSGKEAGSYTLSGTVISIGHESGYSRLTLSDLILDGESVGGKCSATVSTEDVRVGDRIKLTATVSRNGLPSSTDGRDSYAFTGDIRYVCTAESCEVTGRSSSPFLRLNAALYDVLDAGMDSEEGQIAYALLTGSSRSIDDGVLTAVRQGGIAHIFAVSGLHIGILFSAVFLLLKPLKKYRLIPAVLIAGCYSALCGFTVSSVRAVIMCACGGAMGVAGEKHDFLEGISFAAILVLLFSPVQWLSVGFRLSFGACIGLALFGGSLQRGLKFLPRPLAEYLSASLAVQIFTFPVMLEAFGYVSVWGTLLNLVVIPLLPLLFLTLLVTALVSVAMPFAASVLLFPANSMLSALLYAFSAVDFSFVLKGITLGIGVTIWLAGCVSLCQRFRMGKRARAITAVVFALLFTATSLCENTVWTGCKLVTSDGMTLIESREKTVLVLDDSATLRKCEDFLIHRYAGTLDAVIVLGAEGKGINTAAFLPCKEIWAREQTETGLNTVTVCFGERFSVGELSFWYEGSDRLSLAAEGCVVEVSFDREAAMGADLFVGDRSGLIFYLRHGIIREL